MSAAGASKLRSLLKGHQEQDTAPPLTSRYIRVVNTFDVRPGGGRGVCVWGGGAVVEQRARWDGVEEGWGGLGLQTFCRHLQAPFSGWAAKQHLVAFEHMPLRQLLVSMADEMDHTVSYSNVPDSSANSCLPGSCCHMWLEAATV